MYSYIRQALIAAMLGHFSYTLVKYLLKQTLPLSLYFLWSIFISLVVSFTCLFISVFHLFLLIYTLAPCHNRTCFFSDLFLETNQWPEQVFQFRVYMCCLNTICHFLFFIFILPGRFCLSLLCLWNAHFPVKWSDKKWGIRLLINYLLPLTYISNRFCKSWFSKILWEHYYKRLSTDYSWSLTH